jgi:hypothetical protein
MARVFWPRQHLAIVDAAEGYGSIARDRAGLGICIRRSRKRNGLVKDTRTSGSRFPLVWMRSLDLGGLVGTAMPGGSRMHSVLGQLVEPWQGREAKGKVGQVLVVEVRETFFCSSAAH